MLRETCLQYVASLGISAAINIYMKAEPGGERRYVDIEADKNLFSQPAVHSHLPRISLRCFMI